MKKPLLILCASLFLSTSFVTVQANKVNPTAQQASKTPKIIFPSEDKIPVTADMYLIDDHSPMIILCHQAGYSRGEYKDTAHKLNKMGFNCMAIDQRSGNEVNGIANETAAYAKAKNMKQNYLSAEADIIGAITYASQKFKNIILFGSSYSASLVLKIANENPTIKGVISFSPGEYFGDELELSKNITHVKQATFLSSAKSEAATVKTLAAAMPQKNLVHFIPTEEGVHGSKALWTKTANHKEYWTALEQFLANFKK